MDAYYIAYNQQARGVERWEASQPGERGFANLLFRRGDSRDHQTRRAPTDAPCNQSFCDSTIVAGHVDYSRRPMADRDIPRYGFLSLSTVCAQKQHLLCATAVGERNSRCRCCSDGRGNAGYDFNFDSCLTQGLYFFARAAKYEWV